MMSIRSDRGLLWTTRGPLENPSMPQEMIIAISRPVPSEGKQARLGKTKQKQVYETPMYAVV